MTVLVLAGPTGVGKSDVAAVLARRHGFEVVSADSRQVYRQMDIGTAKPDRAAVPVHMIDVADPDQSLTAADYARAALAVVRRLNSEGRRYIIVGGSGFYLRALFRPLFHAPAASAGLRRELGALSSAALHDRLRSLDPERAAQLHPNDRQRVIRAIEVCQQTGRPFTELARERPAATEFEPTYAVLSLPRLELYRRIGQRFDQMMKQGLLDEVRGLVERGYGEGTRVGDTYGYAELLDFLRGRCTLAEAVSRAKQQTRAYAKRQISWFRSLSSAQWVERASDEETANRLESLPGVDPDDRR
jgi:tRNA dimethylallyltransferase